MPYQLEITIEVVDDKPIRTSAALKLDGMPVFLMHNSFSNVFTISPFVNADVHVGIDLDKKAKPSGSSSLLIEVCKDGGLCFVHRELGFVFVHRNGAVQCSVNDNIDAVFIDKIIRNGEEVSPTLYYANKVDKLKKIKTLKKVGEGDGKSIRNDETDLQTSLSQEVKKVCNDMISYSDNDEQKAQREAIASRMCELLKDKYELSPKDIALENGVMEFKSDMKRIVTECMPPETPISIRDSTVSFWMQTLLLHLNIKIKNNGVRIKEV